MMNQVDAEEVYQLLKQHLTTTDSSKISSQLLTKLKRLSHADRVDVINRRNENGETLLRLAVARRRLDDVRMLVEHGALVRLRAIVIRKREDGSVIFEKRLPQMIDEMLATTTKNSKEKQQLEAISEFVKTQANDIEKEGALCRTAVIAVTTNDKANLEKFLEIKGVFRTALIQMHILNDDDSKLGRIDAQNSNGDCRKATNILLEKVLVEQWHQWDDFIDAMLAVKDDDNLLKIARELTEKFEFELIGAAKS